MSTPPFSVGEYTTPRLSFAEDLDAYAKGGAQGIGIDVSLKIRDAYSFVNTIPDAVDLLAEIDEPNVGILFDIWHLGDTPDVLDHIRAHASRFLGVHVNDRRSPTRSWCDRVLPGDGGDDVHGILAAVEDAGFEGWYELEVFSDDGMFGNDYPDSLWKLDPVELVRRGREKFELAWEHRRAGAAPSA